MSDSLKPFEMDLRSDSSSEGGTNVQKTMNNELEQLNENVKEIMSQMKSMETKMTTMGEEHERQISEIHKLRNDEMHEFRQLLEEMNDEIKKLRHQVTDLNRLFSQSSIEQQPTYIPTYIMKKLTHMEVLELRRIERKFQL